MMMIPDGSESMVVSLTHRDTHTKRTKQEGNVEG